MNELKNIISLFNGFTVEGYIWMSDATCPICYEMIYWNKPYWIL